VGLVLTDLVDDCLEPDPRIIISFVRVDVRISHLLISGCALFVIQ